MKRSFIFPEEEILLNWGAMNPEVQTFGIFTCVWCQYHRTTYASRSFWIWTSQIHHISVKVLKVLYVFLAYTFQIHIFRCFAEHLVDYIVSSLNTEFKSMSLTTKCLKIVFRKKNHFHSVWPCFYCLRVLGIYQSKECLLRRWGKRTEDLYIACCFFSNCDLHHLKKI